MKRFRSAFEWKKSLALTGIINNRVGHFAQGFIPAILHREVLYRFQVLHKLFWRELIVFAFVMAFTALFELLEFAAAMTFGKGADAFLGSQGDVWDAQWDILLCGLDGLQSIVLLSKSHENKLKNACYPALQRRSSLARIVSLAF